jgi:hypothetical protein
MKKILLTVTVLVITLPMVFGQISYFARNVKLEFHGQYRGAPLLAKSEEVGVRLDYETAELQLNFVMNTVETNIDTLNLLLKNNLRQVVFDGKLGLEYINTQSHPPQYFDLEGLLILDNNRTPVKGTGELHHVNDNGELACMLGLSFVLNLADLGVELPISGLSPDFEAVITQAVLRHDKG